MMELKKIILIDKSVDEAQGSDQRPLVVDINLKLLLDRCRRTKDDQTYTCARAYSYREVMATILHEPFAPSLVLDRFCLAERDVEIELTLRAACKSVARVIALPWMTAERWDTRTQKWHFIQESGELIEGNLLVERIEEALLHPRKFLSKSEVLAGSVSGLELLILLQSLATSFLHGFCYVHTLDGEQRSCLYFERNHLVHCVFYDQLTYSLAQGREGLESFVNSVINLSKSDDAAKQKVSKFCFRFFARSRAVKQIPVTMGIKPEEAFIKAVVALEHTKNTKQSSLRENLKTQGATGR